MLAPADAPVRVVSTGVLSANQARALDAVRRLAEAAGVAAYLVGGPVRDALLGVPLSDLDITVMGDAPALAQQLAAEIGGRLTVHRRFGTASVAWADAGDNLVIDLVTARSETYPAPAALPVVRPGALADDLARRDFTINAMARPLGDYGDGNYGGPYYGDGGAGIIDPHGGQADLQDGIIRTLHRQSFRDDPTRILRAVRYEQRFGFRIAADTLHDLQSARDDGAIALLSADRVRHELARILQEAQPLQALRRADDLGILRAIHPALTASHLEAMALAAADRTESAPAEIKPLDWLGALAWTLTPAEGAALSARINAPSDWMRAIADAADLSANVDFLDADGLAPSQVCALLDGRSPYALAAGAFLAPPTAAARIRRYRAEWWTVAPRLRGSDLLALGVPAGPAVGATLRALRQARLDGGAPTRQDEERLALQSISSLTPTR